MKHWKAIVAALLVLLFCPVAISEVISPFDWCLTGDVANLQEIPNSGGAWAVTIIRPIPELPEADEYLLMICDHEQSVTATCAELALSDTVFACGYVRTNEPSSGQRLTVRKLVVVEG